MKSSLDGCIDASRAEAFRGRACRLLEWRTDSFEGVILMLPELTGVTLWAENLVRYAARQVEGDKGILLAISNVLCRLTCGLIKPEAFADSM